MDDAVEPSTSTTQQSQARRLAHFHPSVWGDFFITNFSYNDQQVVNSWKEDIESLKEEVRNLITDVNNNLPRKLIIVDAFQRLGIAYHFETEIEESLSHVFINTNQGGIKDSDLHLASLCFRLLRQRGFNVPSAVFKKFTDEKGQFDRNLAEDVEGMLSLYEASFLGVHGENILDEAQAFTMIQPESVLSTLKPALAKKVRHALKRPIRKGVTRHETWHFITMYEEEEGHNEVLLKLAKLEFNVVQKLLQGELYSLGLWWKELDVRTRLSFARDRLVEAYFWPLGVFTEPQYAVGRRILGKLVPLFIVIDDVYDAYGTIEELELFTEAIERLGEINMKDKLPYYMKICCQALLDLFAEIGEHVTKEGRSFCMFYAKEAVRNQIRAYITEARWFNQNYVPSAEEHMRVVLTSCCYPLFMAFSLIGIGKIGTKEVFDWLFAEPKVAMASTTISRLMGDIVSYKFERNRGHVVATIDCYVKEYGATEEEACDEFRRRVTSAWKEINEELLRPTEVPMPIMNLILNFARVMDVVYKEEDGVTHSNNTVKDVLATLLINPFTV